MRPSIPEECSEEVELKDEKDSSDPVDSGHDDGDDASVQSSDDST